MSLTFRFFCKTRVYANELWPSDATDTRRSFVTLLSRRTEISEIG